MRRPVVVLGWTVTALGTLRALRKLDRLHYELILASRSKKENIAYHSNVPDKKYIIGNNLVQGLMDMRENFHVNPLLVLTSDADVVDINNNRDELEKHYRFLLPDKNTVETLMEKGLFQVHACANNLQTPFTAHIHNEDELKNIPKVVSFPIIVKPFLLHAKKIEDESQLQEYIRTLKPIHYSSMVVQQYIEGGDDQLYFVFLLFDEKSNLVHRMIARKLRQWPLSYGTTSLATTVSNDDLRNQVDQFISGLKMVGYCSIEYKYDVSTNKFYIMEPTIGRFNQQIALTEKAGINFPLALVKLLSREEVNFKEQANGVLWIYESNDLMAYFKKAGSYKYLGNFFKRHVNVLFAFYDILPFFYEIFMLASKKIKKLRIYG